MNSSEKKLGSERKSASTADINLVQAEAWRQWRDEQGLPLLPDEQAISTVRDSLYDLIPLGARELKLISSAPFLRLQQIKQLLACVLLLLSLTLLHLPPQQVKQNVWSPHYDQRP